MAAIRKADPAARRIALALVVAGAVAGAALIATLERYRLPLRDWLLSDPAESARRIELVFLLLAAFLTVPLLALAAWLWALGGSVLREREFPPAGLPVLRDTPILRNEAALTRGRLLRTIALGAAVAALVLGLLLWRIAPLFGRAA